MSVRFSGLVWRVRKAPSGTIASPRFTSERIMFLSYTVSVRPFAIMSPSAATSNSRVSSNVGSSVFATTALCFSLSPSLATTYGSDVSPSAAGRLAAVCRCTLSVPDGFGVKYGFAKTRRMDGLPATSTPSIPR